MRQFSIAVFAVAAAFVTPALARPPAGFEKIYDTPTKVNLGGRPVIADIAFHVDMAAAQSGDLQLVLTTDVTKFIEETETDLANWIAARREDCGERWSAGEPLIKFPDGDIRFALDIDLEYWTCGWNRKGKPTRVAHEAGSVDVTLNPAIIDGKLQASLGAFSINVTSGVSKYLPLEYVVRSVLEQELQKLNENPKFYRAPQPLYGENFRYESIEAEETSDGRVVITARYRASGSASAFDRIVEKLRTEGITQ